MCNLRKGLTNPPNKVSSFHSIDDVCIIGVKKFQHDLWGDTMNTASRMQSSGAVGKVNISQATYEMLKDDFHFTFESREKTKVKGKGEIEVYHISKA